MPKYLALALAPVLLIAQIYPAAALDLPKRKPGHWRITTVTPMMGEHTADVCIEDKDNIAIPEGALGCSKPEVLKAGADTIVNVTCDSNGSKQTISTAFTGDFETGYHGITKMTFDPPVSGIGKHVGITIDARYVGPQCPPETKP